MSKNVNRKGGEQTEQMLGIAVRKLAAKYQAIVTMVGELQDNLNSVVQTSYALLKEKDAKIMELQVPVKEKTKEKTKGEKKTS